MKGEERSPLGLGVVLNGAAFPCLIGICTLDTEHRARRVWRRAQQTWAEEVRGCGHLAVRWLSEARPQDYLLCNITEHQCPSRPNVPSKTPRTSPHLVHPTLGQWSQECPGLR